MRVKVLLLNFIKLIFALNLEQFFTRIIFILKQVIIIKNNKLFIC